MARHNINISDEVWQIAAKSGNASAYIERAVKANYLREVEEAANAVVAALPQSEIDAFFAWGSAATDRELGNDQ
ncbi:hypothetical protein [Glycomyces sp. NPDC048151]|uniref:hypothetical protein n=1 Tax=Glycomyces sp. NPDC048151 TaxID=3364002 RepID=UPI003723C508